jgi:hypothetical protein
VCAARAQLDDLGVKTGPTAWLDRSRRRLVIGWLNFLEPLARDWGRLKGGLTPWRSVPTQGAPSSRGTRWWQRLPPFRHASQWTHRAGPSLEKYAFLGRLTNRLVARGWAVGWNPDWQDWDLKVRRGTLGEAKLHMVVEHHGGPRRLGRLSTLIRPSKSVYWTQVALGLAALGATGLELYIPLAILLAFLGVLWAARIAEANRLEATINSAADEVVSELGAKGGEEGQSG